MRWFRALLVCLLAAACGGSPGFDDEGLPRGTIRIEEALAGRHTAWGVFQDRFGTVRRSFTVDLLGTWDGETLTLEEDFLYEDGSTERRVWRLVPTGPDTWTGTAEGVQGTPAGRVAGPVFNWTYTITLQTPDGPLTVDLDDWIWQLGDGALMNRAYVSKYGFRIGELLIFFRREG